MDDSQAGIKITRRNNNFRYAADTILMAESEEEVKILLMKVKEESEKAGLKFNIQETKVTASSLITSRQIDGEKVKTVADFIFLGFKITTDSDYSHEIKRCLLLQRKVMIKKRRHYFANKYAYCQSYVFSSSRVQMWELDFKEGWAPKNCCFQIVVLEKTRVSPLDGKEIKPVSP